MKNKLRYKHFLHLLIILLTNTIALSSAESINISILNKPAPGYINFSNPVINNSAFSLFDNYGLLKYFENSPRGQMQKLLENGQWVIASPEPNKLYLYNKQISLVDTLNLVFANDSLYIDNHDFLSLSNGRFMIAMTKVKTMDLSKIVDGGQTNARVMGHTLLEIDKHGNIYWSWDCFNYLDITEVTTDVDLTQMVIDFTHFNSFVVDTDNNLIVSLRNLDQIIKINRSTGSIMWRMGGKASKFNQFQFVKDTVNGFYGFSHQHSISMLPNGNMLIYDNGTLKPNFYSRAVEYQLNQFSKIATKVWEFRHTPDIQAANMGNVQRLANGNTLINWGSYYVTEVRPDKTIALEFPISTIYRVEKHIINMDAVIHRITSGGNYNFSNPYYATGVKLELNSVSGAGNVCVEKHKYLPLTVPFAQQDYTSILPYRWVINADSINAVTGKLVINLNDLNGITDAGKLSIYKRNQETNGNFSALITEYDQYANELTASITEFGEIIICSNQLQKPISVSPQNNAYGVTLNQVFIWKKLKGAVNYQFQISEDSDFTTSLTDTVIGNDTTCLVNALSYDKLYYWRVRGMNIKDTSSWSDLRVFKTKLPSPELMYPINTRVGVLIDDTLKWSNLGVNIKYQLQLSKNPEFSLIAKDTNGLLNSYYQLNLETYNTDYYWRVRAYRQTDSSQWSDTFSFTTILNSPDLLVPLNDSVNAPLKLDLKWTSVAGALSYTLQLSKNPVFQNDVSEFNVVNKFSQFVDNLNYEQDYYWRVRAVRLSDSSDFSKTNKFSTLLSSPALYYPKNDTNNINSAVDFVWDLKANATSYQLQIAYNESFDSLYKNLNNLTENIYTISNFPKYLKFYWRLRYFANNKISDWSEVRSFSIGKGSGLSAPALLSPKDKSTQNNISTVFQWQSVENAKYYTLQISGDIDFENIVIYVEKIELTSYEYSNFDYSTNYYWRVKALNEFDSSNWSMSWKMTTMDRPKLNPIRLTSPSFDAMLIPINGSLLWVSNDNALKYHLQLSTDQNFVDLILDENDLKTTKYDYKNLKKNTDYFWKVRYFTSDDSSSWSDIWEFRTESDDILPAPKLMEITSNNIAVPVKGVLKWQAVDKATTYKIGISKSQDFYPRAINVSWHKDLELKYSGLDYNTVYYWRVAGQNDNATSKWSESQSFLTELAPVNLSQPSNNSDSENTTGLLSWSEVVGAKKYKILLSIDENFDEIIIDDSTNNVSSYNYKLQPLTKYYWKVRAIDDKNYSQWSEVYTFTTNNTIGINELKEKSLYFYPNPCSEKIVLKLDENDIYTITIYNELSQVIYKNEVEINSDCDFIINLSENNSGLYWISVINSKNIYIDKFILMK